MLLAVMTAGLLGCSSVSGEPARPTPVMLRPTAPPVHSFVPGVHRYVDDSDRLVIPTLTPTPAPTPRPAPVFSGSSPAEPVVGPDSLPDDEGGELDCTAQYRRSLIDYRGRIPFGAEVARDLAEQVRENRPGCVDEGWAPELEPGRACLRGRIAGLHVSPGLTGRSNPIALPVLLTSGRDDAGNILIHFARLPSQDARGCWYYDVDLEAWAWLVSGRDSGIDRRPFPLCDSRLREMISVSASPDFGPAEVARAADRVRLENPAACSSPLWSLFPSSHPHEDCGSPSGTGIDDDGSLVITWHGDYTPSDYAVCWVLPAGADAWDVHYVRDDPDAGGDS